MLSPDAPYVIHPWEDFDTLVRHANRARAAGDLQRAGTFYARAIELNPNSAEAWVGRASTTTNLDEAIIAWGYALALAPDAPTRAMLGACVSEKIKQTESEQAASLVALGRQLAEAGQVPWAYRLFVRATALAPSDDAAWVWRAGVSGDASETQRCLQRALEINPQNAQAKAGLQWIESKQKTVAPSAAPTDAVVLIEEGQRVLQVGDRAGACERFTRATELDPENATAWFWRGSTAADNAETLRCMERVIAINPNDQAAKDARWWLRIRQLRERAPALAKPLAPPTLDPYTARFPEKRTRVAPVLALVLVAILLVGLTGLVVLLLFAGFFR
ncbi:MAG TPA: tetratricopeptide repeat protein [Anaerolineae bacterium]